MFGDGLFKATLNHGFELLGKFLQYAGNPIRHGIAPLFGLQTREFFAEAAHFRRNGLIIGSPGLELVSQLGDAVDELVYLSSQVLYLGGPLARFLGLFPHPIPLRLGIPIVGSGLSQLIGAGFEAIISKLASLV
ncbi:MAG: hypothetical protein M2R46_04784 [Verrucomicrobia subdivision 3 bacterium]|nr:hypothetical protein [Limisphaerales bacterium]